MIGAIRGQTRAAAPGRGAAALLAVTLAMLPLGACGADNAAEATATTTAGATAPLTAGSPGGGTAPTTAQPGTGTPSTSTSTGCPAGGSIPDGANTGATADLDGDGRPDTLWLSGGEDRTLGVATASGAVFSTEFSSAAPQAASALGARLGDGSAIVLLDTGRSVPLYAVIDCELVTTGNAQGRQYTFDLGFTGYGTGVGCVDLGQGLQLVGLYARPNDDGRSFEVSRTPILLQDHGASAANGTTEVIATEAAADDPAVTAAQSVTCGEAGVQVHEPVD